MNEIKLMGLHSNSGGGKDTVTNIIRWLTTENNPFIQDIFTKESVLISIAEGKYFIGQTKWKNKKYATFIKESLQKAYPKDFSVRRWETGGDEYRNGIIPLLGITRRKALQELGNKLRDIHPDFHVNILFNTKPSEWSKWLVSDVRHINEAERILQEGGIMLKIERDVNKEDEMYNHYSETALKDWNKYTDYIDNNVSYKYTLEQVTNILVKHKIIDEQFLKII